MQKDDQNMQVFQNKNWTTFTEEKNMGLLG